MSLRSLLLAAALPALSSFGADPAPVSFRREIAPLLQRRCVACHGEENAKGGYRVDTWARLARAGESELPALTPGDAEKSELFQLLVESDSQDRMPQRAEALPAAEIALVRRWIAEGARNDAGPDDRPLAELVRETFLRPAPAHYPRPIPVTALAFNPAGTQLAAAGYHEITIWDTDTTQLVRRVGGLSERITSLAWNPARNLLAVAGGAPAQWGAVWLIDPARGWAPRLLCDLGETALSVAFSPDGATLIAGCGDRTIRQFDTTSGKPVRLWRSHADWVQTIAFDAEGKRFVAASRDRTARIYELASGEPVMRYDGHEAPVLAAVFPPDGSAVISLARGQPIQQWETTTGQRAAELPSAGLDVQVLRFFDRSLLTGGTSGAVRLVQLADRAVFLNFHGHRDAIDALAVAPGGRTFATGDHRGEVRIWTPDCEAPQRTFSAAP